MTTYKHKKQVMQLCLRVLCIDTKLVFNIFRVTYVMFMLHVNMTLLKGLNISLCGIYIVVSDNHSG